MIRLKHISLITGKNIKHHIVPYILLSLGVLFLTPLIFGVRNIGEQELAQPLEIAISLIGLLLSVSVFLPEQDTTIESIIRTKQVSPTLIFTLRTICVMLCIPLLIAVFMGWVFLQGSQITYTLYIGTLSSAYFLGGVGMFCLALFHNLATAYMIPLIYYGASFAQGLKFKEWNLFFMTMEYPSYKTKLLITGLLLMIASLGVKKMRTHR